MLMAGINSTTIDSSARSNSDRESLLVTVTCTLREDWTLLTSTWNQASKETKQLVDDQNYDKLQELVVSFFEIKKDDRGKKLSEAFDRVVDFFAEFNSCLEFSLCDQNSGTAMLTPSAKDFIDAYGAYIKHLREKFDYQTFGSAIYKVRVLEKEPWYSAMFPRLFGR